MCTNSAETYTWPGSNWRPSACEADDVATRPKVLMTKLTQSNYTATSHASKEVCTGTRMTRTKPPQPASPPASSTSLPLHVRASSPPRTSPLQVRASGPGDTIDGNWCLGLSNENGFRVPWGLWGLLGDRARVGFAVFFQNSENQKHKKRQKHSPGYLFCKVSMIFIIINKKIKM